MLDYIIVGCGLAGIAFAENACENNKSFIVINNQSQNSSKIAGGLYNPVILKRFSSVWKAKEQLHLGNDFYSKLEIKLNCKLDYKLPLLRKLFSVEEQNNWFIASDKPNLSEFLSSTLVTTKFNYIPSKYAFGEVLFSGYVDTHLLVKEYVNYLKKHNFYLEDNFEHSKIIFNTDSVEYKNVKARHIIFAEGFGMRLNPFFAIYLLMELKANYLS